jgi:hypothetical protein
MDGSTPGFVRFREISSGWPNILIKSIITLYQQTNNQMETPDQIPDSGGDDLANQSKESRLVRLVRAYQRIPVLGRLPGRFWIFLLTAALAILLNILFPPGDCTCEDQFTDQKLEVMARQGNQAVRRYLAQKDNPINCAGRREELLQELEKEKNKGHPKR